MWIANANHWQMLKNPKQPVEIRRPRLLSPPSPCTDLLAQLCVAKACRTYSTPALPRLDERRSREASLAFGQFVWAKIPAPGSTRVFQRAARGLVYTAPA